MNIIKHILSKKQNSEHFISIIIYSTMEIMKSEINLKLNVLSVLTWLYEKVLDILTRWLNLRGYALVRIL